MQWMAAANGGLAWVLALAFAVWADAPPWVSRVPVASYFETLLEPTETEPELGIAALATWLGAMGPEADLTVTRVLQSGQEYVSRVRFSRIDTGALRVALSPSSGPQLAMEFFESAERRRGLRVRTADDQIVAEILDLSVASQAILPFSFGDVRLADVVGVLGALGAGQVETRGRLAGAGTQELIVFGIDLHPPPAEGDFDTVGASVLFAVRAEDGRIRWLRVFDRERRLVRVADDITAEPAAWRFRVTDLTVASHTVVEASR